MKNDEKIDIILNDDKTEEELNREEVINQNYQTAQRYINIAEYMRQYEEQDKYYHRAIQTLEKCNEDHRFDKEIEELNYKKFAVRTNGKITLYKEACKIRDKAKSPQDYYSAQAVFRRIAKYEPNHTIQEKWVSPELYQEALKCSDSAKQADLCEKMAVAREKADKRQSLYASVALIVVILALVVFSRTTMARRVLAYAYETVGIHTGAWQKYNAVYRRTGEKEAYLKYLENRYKAAKHALDEGDLDMAYDDFAAVSRPEKGFGYDRGYEDSCLQFSRLEQQRIKESPAEEVVHFAGMDWRILERQDDRVLLIKDESLGSIPFDEAGKHSSWADSSVRKWLNNTFLTENFSQEETDLILDTEVVTEKNTYFPGVDPGETTTDKLFLMSIGEEQQYYDLLHETETCWWLRTPGAHEGSMAFVYRDKEVMPYGYEVSNTEITVKPLIWLSLN